MMMTTMMPQFQVDNDSGSFSVTRIANNTPTLDDTKGAKKREDGGNCNEGARLTDKTQATQAVIRVQQVGGCTLDLAET